MTQLPNAFGHNQNIEGAQTEAPSLLTGKPVRLADIIAGQFADKRRMGTHPERMVAALKTEYPDLAAAIQETGEYVVVLCAVNIEQAKANESQYMGQRLNGGTYQPGYMNHGGMMGLGFSIAVFAGSAGTGVQFNLHPNFDHGISQLGEAGILNLVLDLLTKGTINKDVGFSQAVE